MGAHREPGAGKAAEKLVVDEIAAIRLIEVLKARVQSRLEYTEVTVVKIEPPVTP